MTDRKLTWQDIVQCDDRDANLLESQEQEKVRVNEYLGYCEVNKLNPNSLANYKVWLKTFRPDLYQKSRRIPESFHYELPVFELWDGGYWAIAVSRERARKAAIAAIVEEFETFDRGFVNECLAKGIKELPLAHYCKMTLAEFFAHKVIEGKDSYGDYLACWDGEEVLFSQLNRDRQAVVREVVEVNDIAEVYLYRVS